MFDSLTRPLAAGNWRTLAPLVAMLLGASCADTPRAGECADDTQCGADTVCNLDTNQCVPRASGKLSLLEVVPPSGNKQGWVAQEFPSARAGDDGEVLLRLRPVVSVQGQVFASHAPGEPVAAQVTAWRPSLLPGRPDVQTVASTDSTGGDRFVLWLEAGHEYQFHIKPLPPHDQRFPPRVEKLRVERHVKRDFALDGHDRAIEVRGQVHNAVGDALPFSVQVRAHRAGTSVRSTVGRTCHQDQPTSCPGGVYSPGAAGQFSIRIPPGVEPYTIRVESISQPEKSLRQLNPIPVIPTLECAGKVLGLVEASQGQLQTISAIRLPAFAYARMHATSVVGRGESGEPSASQVAGQALAGVQVKFTTRLQVKPGVGFKECQSFYSATGITDAEGRVQLPLLPGDTKNRSYDVQAVSPASNSFASQYLTAALGAAGGVLQTIVLEARYAVSGTILDPIDQGIAGASIEARGIETTDSSQQVASGLPPGKAATTADAQGKFVLHVDPGLYNLHVRPPEDSGLPHLGIEKRSIAGPVDGMVVHVPVPRVLAGEVLDEAGKPVSSFTVNAYETVTDSLSSEQGVLRAHATTDQQGRFRLLLAP